MADSETTTIRLDNDITVNNQTFKAGAKVEVPKNQADDLSRMDHEYNVYKDNLNKKQTFQTKVGSTIVVGSQQ